MKIITLTHNVSGRDVLINWDNILFVAETENNFGEKYTEVAFETQGAIPVKQTPQEIQSLLTSE